MYLMAGRPLIWDGPSTVATETCAEKGLRIWGLAWVNDTALRNNLGAIVRLLSEKTKIKDLLVCPRNLVMEDTFVRTLILILETRQRIVSPISFSKQASIDFDFMFFFWVFF